MLSPRQDCWRFLLTTSATPLETLSGSARNLLILQVCETAQIEPEALTYLLSLSEARQFSVDETTSTIENTEEYVYLVQSGLFVVEREFTEGSPIPVQFLKHARTFFRQKCQKEIGAVRIRAVEAGIILRIPYQAVPTACELWPKFSKKLLDGLSNNLYFENTISHRVARLPLAEQIAFLFWCLGTATSRGEGCPRNLEYSIPQLVLGKYFGVSREEVGRKLKQLISARAITKLDKGFLLTLHLHKSLASFGVHEPPEQFLATVFMPFTYRLPPDNSLELPSAPRKR